PPYYPQPCCKSADVGPAAIYTSWSGCFPPFTLSESRHGGFSDSPVTARRCAPTRSHRAVSGSRAGSEILPSPPSRWRNIEVGALVTDERFSRALVEQFDALIRAGAVVQVPLG